MENLIEEYYDLLFAVEDAITDGKSKHEIVDALIAEGIERKKAKLFVKAISLTPNIRQYKVRNFGLNLLTELKYVGFFLTTCGFASFLNIQILPIYVYLILFVLFTIFRGIALSLAQTKVYQHTIPDFTNKEDAKNRSLFGLKQGRWVEYIKDGEWVDNENEANYYRLAVYKNGMIAGKARTYFKSGKLALETNYLDDKEEGPEKECYESGEIMALRNYKNGLLDGIENTYWESGNLMAQTPYEDNIKHGLEKHYYENGKLKCTIFYENGKRNGEEIHYSESGEVTEAIHNYNKEDE